MEIDAAATAFAGTGPAAIGKQKDNEMGKEDFLKLMVTQLTQQDPLNPQDGTEYVAQLAQFSSLERMLNIEKGMGNVVLAATATNSTLSVGFIGKQIRTPGNSVTLGADRQADIQFSVEDNATANIEITNESGDVVRTLTHEAQAGSNTVHWDGMSDSGEPVPEGTYKFNVTATNAEGADVTSSSTAVHKVKAVSFKNGFPELLLENGKTVSLSEVSEVLDEAAASPKDEE